MKGAKLKSERNKVVRKKGEQMKLMIGRECDFSRGRNKEKMKEKKEKERE